MHRRRLLLALALALLGVAVGTYVAGEAVEVVVLRTVDAAGSPHDTKLWVVDHDGAPWVRVATSRRRWFQRLTENPRVELVRNGARRRALARPDASPATRAALDRAFRRKYGAVDWWYGVLLRRGAIPVRLELGLASPSR